MRIIIGVLAHSLVTCNLCAEITEPVGGTPEQLRLCWREANGRYPLARNVIQSEVATILRTVDIEVRWIDDAEASGETFLTIVLRDSVPTAWGVPPDSMGVILKEDRPTDAIFVLLPAIMQNLGLDSSMKRLPTPRERVDLAKAIARVVVHELVHVLAPEMDHGEKGVVRSAMSRYALLYEDVELDDDVGQAMRHGLSRLRTAPRGRSRAETGKYAIDDKHDPDATKSDGDKEKEKRKQ